MKKQLLKFGKALSKAEQKLIHGGNDPVACNEEGSLCCDTKDEACKRAKCCNTCNRVGTLGVCT